MHLSLNLLSVCLTLCLLCVWLSDMSICLFVWQSICLSACCPCVCPWLTGCLCIYLTFCFTVLSVWLIVRLCICLSVWLSVLPFCLSDWLSVCASVCLSVCLTVRCVCVWLEARIGSACLSGSDYFILFFVRAPSMSQFIYLSMYLLYDFSIHLFVFLSIYLSICLSLCLSLSLFLLSFSLSPPSSLCPFLNIFLHEINNEKYTHTYIYV